VVDVSTKPEAPLLPTWEAFMKALAAARGQGFALVQVVTACPGDGFETMTVTVRKPSERER